MSDYEFTPTDSGDLMSKELTPVGAYEAKVQITKGKTSTTGKPMLTLRWQIASAHDDANKNAVGSSEFDRVIFFNRDEKGFEINARTVRELTKSFSLPTPDSSSLKDGKWDSLEPWIAALESETRTIYLSHRDTKDGDTEVKIGYTQRAPSSRSMRAF